MEIKKIKYLKEHNLKLEQFKITQIIFEEDSDIIKRFNKDLDQINDLDNKLISRVKKEKKNWKKINISIDNYYVGELENNTPDGLGIIYKKKFSEDIFEYIGYFRKGKFEGYGRKYDQYEGINYLGFFIDDKYNGFGILIYYDRIDYIGYFNEGKYNNYGKLLLYNNYFKYQG